MPVLDTLKSVLGREEESFTYECLNCDRVFEAATPSSSQATCPDCEQSRTRSVPERSADG